jgi:hypothetical protein
LAKSLVGVLRFAVGVLVAVFMCLHLDVLLP